MAVSTTTFEERLGRIDRATPQLFAGNDAPQAFSPEHLVCKSPKRRAFNYLAIVTGLGAGAAVGFAFAQVVGFDIFLTQPPLMILAIVKADPQMLGLCLAMLAGLVLTLLCQIFGYTKARALHFWTSYLFGSLVVNVQAYYYLYLTYFA